MTICTKTCFQKGGRELIELLTHCVYAFNTDVLFLYLTQEYQFRPQAVSAIAIYDVFCAAAAPARISDASLIPPKDMRIEQTITRLRQAVLATTTDPSRPESAAQDRDPSDDASGEHCESPPPMRLAIELPPRYLFDSVAAQLAGSEQAKIAALESYYDPKLTPQENLPGGELTAGQRVFVDHVWTPRIRPYLVSSGFWRVATVG